VANYDNSPTIGPGRGTLVIHGGKASPWFWSWFRCLCGANARFVVIPTAMPDDRLQAFTSSFKAVPNSLLLHTKDRDVADTDAFAKPLREASAVWITGGRQWRLAKNYLGTAVEREIKALLARGGVVGGSSAGASIQASYLVRAKEGDAANPNGDNQIVMASPYDKGFGLLPNSAIDQHVDKNRQNDLQQVLAVYPDILGIGIYEDTAIVVRGDVFEVHGIGKVIIHDRNIPPYQLSPGQRFNLRQRSAT
jgi:cyanophycinase